MSDQHEATTGEIMEFLNDHMVTKEEFTNEFAKVREEFTGEFAKVREEFTRDLSKTKLELLDAMDDKLLNLKTDLVTIMRKEDYKVTALVGLLRTKQVLSDDEAKSLLGMEPFAQISLS